MQALAQERFGLPPVYHTVLDGNIRPRQYVSQVSVEGGPVLGEGSGGTKQAAEQGAARAAIDRLVAGHVPALCLRLGLLSRRFCCRRPLWQPTFP